MSTGASIITAWSYGGTDLTASGLRVRQVPEQIPARRGDNLLIPSKHGSRNSPHYYDERRITLAMLVEDRSVWGAPRSSATLQSTLDTIKQLFGRPGLQTLQRTLQSGRIESVEAEVLNVLEFPPGGPYHYDFVIELVAPDPRWVPSTGGTTDSNSYTGAGTATFTNPGTSPCWDPTITITGGSVLNPRLANMTDGSAYVWYDGAIGSGEILRLNTEMWVATLGSVDVTENIYYGNGVEWLRLLAGDNQIALSGDTVGGTTTVQFAFTPGYW